MRKTTALWSLILLISLSGAAPARSAERSVLKPASLAPARNENALSPAPQAKQPQWSGREEYDANQAMKAEQDPNKKIALADAYLKNYPKSDFKADAYIAKMAAYFQLGRADNATEAARDALQTDPDNLDALALLSYVFPFTFKGNDPDAAAKLSRTEGDARHGLEVLQKLQKPADLSDEKFSQFVKPKRAIFNNTVGLVALQKKDYAGAITSFKAAAEDAPSDFTTFYRLGLAYWYSSPPDYDHAAWYMARSTSLARAAKNSFEADVMKDLKRLYVNYHGTDQGLEDIVTQAAASANPPEGFKLTPMETPKETGDPNVDNFNKLTFKLKLGGETAQKTWDAIKNQEMGLGGAIESVQPGKDTGTYSVRIDVLPQSKAAEGVYDVEVLDATQPNVKNLAKGDLVRFQGTIDSYVATPNLVLTVKGTIVDPDPLPDKPKPKEKPKPPARHPPAPKPQT